MDEKLRFRHFIVPVIFALLMLIQIVLQELYKFDFSPYAIQPRKTVGLTGILCGGFIHGDWSHFISNIIPFLLFSIGMFIYYKFAFKTLISIMLLTNFYVWIIGEPNTFHVGISGLIYGLASFHITSAILRKEKRIIAFAMLIIFLYGSLIWGFFPEFFPQLKISWESHLMGFITGIVFAFYYKDEGPQGYKYPETEEEENEEDAYWKIPMEKALEKDLNENEKIDSIV